MDHWYLIRTKSGLERRVREQLDSQLRELFLSLLKTKVRRWGMVVGSVVPIELPDTLIRNGESVQVLRGPLRGLGAVFEGYLAGTERVRILFCS
jgi:transcription antitermination factor NusG